MPAVALPPAKLPPLPDAAPPTELLPLLATLPPWPTAPPLATLPPVELALAPLPALPAVATAGAPLPEDPAWDAAPLESEPQAAAHRNKPIANARTTELDFTTFRSNAPSAGPP